MPMPAAYAEIAENMRLLDDWEDRYRYLIELGQALPDLAPDERNDVTKVNGCVSQVWLVSESDEGIMSYRGESDAMIVRGLVAILVALYSGRPVAEVAATDAIAELDSLGLREHLTTQRSNGLIAMVRRIREEAALLAA